MSNVSQERMSEDQLRGALKQMTFLHDKAVAERDGYKAALEWYADHENYEQEMIELDKDDFAWDAPSVIDDNGERARKTLKGDESNA